MPTTTVPPILIWSPGGGTPIGPVSNPPVYSQADITQLVIGQAYVDVVFGSAQVDTTWVLVECDVVNTLDLAPLNIWPGIITNRTTAGFRVWLNGLPDSGNYYLHWAVSGVNILPVPASLYLFTGPTSSAFGVNKTFTVKLPPSTTLSSPVTVTPNDGGLGGTFSPPTVTLSSGSATATFTYNAVAYGAATLSVTNSGTLIDPAPIVYTSIAPTYTFTGPSGGASGVPSTNFTVQLPGDATLAVPTTITPHDGGSGGTFTPTSVLLVAGVPVHFTYTAAASGTIIISTTNDGGLSNPPSLTYTATPPPISDGDPVNSWNDSSGNGHTATQTGSSRPVYKTAILNGKPVVRFTAANSNKLMLASPASTAFPWTAFVVMKGATTTSIVRSLGNSGSGSPMGPSLHSDSAFIAMDRANAFTYPGGSTSAFRVFSFEATPSGVTYQWINGVSGGAAWFATVTTFDFDQIGADGAPTYTNGDIAEIIMYSGTLALRAKAILLLTALLTTAEFPSPGELDAMIGDRARIKHYLHQHGAHPTDAQLDEAVTPFTVGDRVNIEAYLGTKYAITQTGGGTAVDPTTVSGLAAWWKADSGIS